MNSRTKNLIGQNREFNRDRSQNIRVSSRDVFYNSVRGIKFDEPGTVQEGSTETSRELMLKKWKAQKELKKKEQDLKKPTFVVRTTSKIPSIAPIKVYKHSSLQKTSFNKTELHLKKCEKNLDAPRLSQKTVPKITTTLTKSTFLPKKSENILNATSHKAVPKTTTSTFNKPTLPSKKENFLNGPTSHKTIPKTTSFNKAELPLKKCEKKFDAPRLLSQKTIPKLNLPTTKTSSVPTSTLKPSKLQIPEIKVHFPWIPKATPKVFLFGNKNTEKTAFKSKLDKSKTKTTDPVNETSRFLSCNISHIESKFDHQKIQECEEALCVEDSSLTPIPNIKIRTSTPLKETASMQESLKNGESDTLALLADFSSSVQQTSISEKDSTITEKLEEKTPGTCSTDNTNNLLEDKVQLSITQSLNDEFANLKVEEIDLESFKSEETQIDNTITKNFKYQIQTPISPCIQKLEMELTPRRSERLKEKIETHSLENVQSLVKTSEIKFVNTGSCENSKMQIDGTKDSKTQIETPTSILSSKIPETDNLTPRRSQRLKEKNEKFYSLENLQSMAGPSEIKLVDIGSCKKEITQINSTIRCSERVIKKDVRKDSCEDLLNMPRPSVMGLFDTDSLNSPPAAAAHITYDFENLEKEDHRTEKKNDKNLKKVSLLYDPHRRQTRYSSIKGDLISFSPPE